MRRILLAVIAIVAAAAARASVYHVTNLGDSGTGSLRWAVDQANLGGGPDQIVFDVSGTIATASPIATTEQVLIDAAGAVTVAATGASPAALILGGLGTRVRGMTVTNSGGAGIILRGDSSWVETCDVGPNSGDGIRVEGGANKGVAATTVASSQSGIVVEGSYGATISGCSIDGNRADGILADAASDTFTIGRSRIANNGGNGLRMQAINVQVSGNQFNDNGADGIVHETAARGAYDDNWLARNGGNGLTILGAVSEVLDNSGNCNKGMLIDYGGDGPSANSADALQGGPDRPVLLEALRDLSSTTVSGTIDSFPLRTFVVAFHPAKAKCPHDDPETPDTISVQTDSSGRASFNVILPSRDEDSMVATITATGGTKMSEPSAPIAVESTPFIFTDVAVSTSLFAESSGNDAILTFTTTVTNRGPGAARDVVLTFTPPPLAPAQPSDVTATAVPLGNLVAGASIVLRQSFLWPSGSGPVRYEARVTHDLRTDLDPSNDVAVVLYTPKRRAVR